MRILMVATKAPWPPTDGGRLVLLTTIDALNDQGHEITLVAPVDPSSDGEAREQLAKRCRPYLVASAPRNALTSLAMAEVTRRPVTIVRHAHGAVRSSVEALLRDREFDVVHVEQQQAMYGVRGAFRAGIPVVVRAHNVESALWLFAADHRRPLLRWWFLREARRLQLWEAAGLNQANHIVALTDVDASRLAELTGSKRRITVVQAPFVSELPASRDHLRGNPAVVILASGAWQPNRDAVWQFANDIWPTTHRALPDARLHVFGVSGPANRKPGVEWHDSPKESLSAFPVGSVLAVPARHPTGVPMKCLEAWARGLPIVGCRLAAEQLDARDGETMLVGDSADDFANGFRRLVDEPELRKALVANGRAVLGSRHEPAAIARRLTDVYRVCRAAGLR